VEAEEKGLAALLGEPDPDLAKVPEVPIAAVEG
jgi:hypothetical protein